jgi:predicted permease
MKPRQQMESEMRAEMEFHIQARIEDLIRRGLSPEQAARTARQEFGNTTRHREDSRSARGFQPLDELRADLRYAARCLRNTPGFAFAAIAILALAIGVNAAFFTLYAGYVLKPLPIRGADRHFDITGLDAQARRTGGWSTEELDALRQSARSQIEDLYTASTVQVLLLAPSQRHSLVTYASSNYFQLLGVSPAAGAPLNAANAHEPVAVLSHSGWRKLFAAETNPIGKSLRIGQTVYTVVGLMPPQFTGTETAIPDMWLPAALRGSSRFNASGLLRPGASPAHAMAALSTAATRFARPREEPIAKVDLSLRPGAINANDDFDVAATMVSAAFAMVLLIACANLANLYLARAASRTHEIAMRLSLGATRFRIVRQLLTESIFVAFIGAATGLALAAFAVHNAESYLAAATSSMGISLLPVAIDWRVFLFSATLGIVAGIAFGLLPALEVTSPSLVVSTKRENSAFAGRIRPRRLRNTLLGGQVAASLVLLLLAGVLVRNLQRLNAISPGYSVDQIFDLNIENPTPALLAEIERLPNVTSLSAVSRVPLEGVLLGSPAVTLVDDNYFATLGLPLDAGRNFTRREAETHARVAIVSQSTARKLWPSKQPVGQIITIDDSQSFQVIGVVPDVISGWLFQGMDATNVYRPSISGAHIARLQTSPAAIRALCTAHNTGCEPRPLRDLANIQRFPFQVAAAIAGVLGALALLLTAVGLYSVASYSVVQRRREIGIHLALGATPRQILRRILAEALYCVIGGLAVGVPVCLALSKLASASIFQIQTFDAASYLAVPALLIVIAALAVVVPANRAAQTDPMISLRED